LKSSAADSAVLLRFRSPFSHSDHPWPRPAGSDRFQRRTL